MILTALQKAATRLVSQQPQVFFGSQETLQIELCDLLNEVAQDVAQYMDWQALVKIATVQGNGSTNAFPLPDDYSRMMIKSRVQDKNSWFWGYFYYQDINGFMYDRDHGFPGYPGGWIMFDNLLQFSPTPGAGQNATFPYVSKMIFRGSDGNLKESADNDADTFLLPERLLTLGLVWRWRENKKLDASGDQEAFTKALDEYATKDGGAKVIERSSRLFFPGAQVGWPWPLGGVS